MIAVSWVNGLLKKHVKEHQPEGLVDGTLFKQTLAAWLEFLEEERENGKTINL